MPSKQAAQALLARTYLVWGDNPLSQAEVAAVANSQIDPAFTTTPERLEKAVEYANKVISSGRLALDPEYNKLYGRDYESNKRGTNEHLFTIAHDGDKSDAQSNHQTHCSWTFPFQNGENGNGYTQNHTVVADDDLYDDWKAEQPNDKRLAETYFAEVSAPTFDQIKREWDYEFTYEQFSVLNSYRWKDLISSVQQVKNYKHFADDWKEKQTFTSDQEAYFQKVHNHLVAKYNNVRGKHYLQPIPTGLSGESLGISQNPGY